MAYHLLQHDRAGADQLAQALAGALSTVRRCARCHNFTEEEVCALCRSPRRDASLLCVVETPADLAVVEQTLSYSGMYFVLMGRLSPLDGVGARDIGLDRLLARATDGEVQEVILATNFTNEGEATAHYIAEMLRARDIKVSRIARGVPLGGERSLEAVVGGSADVVAGAYEHTINMQARKQSFQAFVLAGASPQISVGIATSRAASYKSPRDLKGLKVGVSAPGSSTNMVINYVLAKGGLKPTDVAIIGVGQGATVIAAMEQGQVDVLSQTDPAMTMLEKEGKIKIIAETRTPAGTEQLFGGPMPAGSLYAPVEFIKKNPGTVQALTNATVRALLWMQEASPQQILATVPEEYLLGNKAMYL